MRILEKSLNTVSTVSPSVGKTPKVLLYANLKNDYFFFLKNHLITEQVFKKSKSRGSYQGGLDPEKPAKALSDHENLGAIGDRTVKKNSNT